jgi:hypothetical protein
LTGSLRAALFIALRIQRGGRRPAPAARGAATFQLGFHGDGELVATPIPGISNPNEFRRMVLLAQAAEEPVPSRLVA